MIPVADRPAPARFSATEAPELAAASRTETALPAGLVQHDEVVILHLRPSILLVPLSSLASLAAIALVTLTAALLVIRLRALPLTEAQVYGIGAAVAAGRLAWQCADWWSRLYVLTDRRVLCRAGVLRPSVFEAPLRTIQHATVFQPLRERAVGLGSIGFAVTGSQGFDAVWLAIRQPMAVHRVVTEALDRYGRH